MKQRILSKSQSPAMIVSGYEQPSRQSRVRRTVLLAAPLIVATLLILPAAINGREVAGPQALHDGDEIQIALVYKLAFVDAGATVPLVFEKPGPEGLRMEVATHQVRINAKLLEPPLSAQQYRLLELLVNHPGITTREEIVRAVWSDAAEIGVSEQSIDALVRRLRERLAELDPDHQYLVTMRGHGFRFENRQA